MSETPGKVGSQNVFSRISDYHFWTIAKMSGFQAASSANKLCVAPSRSIYSRRCFIPRLAGPAFRGGGSIRHRPTQNGGGCPCFLDPSQHSPGRSKPSTAERSDTARQTTGKKIPAFGIEGVASRTKSNAEDQKALTLYRS